MSAAPQTLKRVSTPREVKTDQYGRDPKSLPEKQRKANGFTMIPHAWLADLDRLTSAKAQMMLLIVLYRMSAGATREKGEPAPELTEPLSMEDLAQFLHCCLREVQLVVKDAVDRTLIRQVKATKGRWQYEVLWKDWQALQDYQAAKRPPEVAKDAHTGEAQPSEPTDEKTEASTPILSASEAHKTEGETKEKVSLESAGYKNYREVRFAFAGGNRPIRVKSGRATQVGILELPDGKNLPIEADYTGPASAAPSFTSAHLDAGKLRVHLVVPEPKKSAPTPPQSSPPLVSQPRSVPRPMIRKARSIDLRDFPIFKEEITEAWQSTGNECIERIIAKSLAAVPDSPEIVTDENLIAGARKTTLGRPKQKSAALFETMIPTWFERNEARLKAKFHEGG